jgi:hypothetical protein
MVATIASTAQTGYQHHFQPRPCKDLLHSLSFNHLVLARVQLQLLPAALRLQRVFLQLSNNCSL